MATTKNTKISYRSNDPIVNEPLIIESGNNSVYIDSNLKACIELPSLMDEKKHFKFYYQREK